MDLATTGTPEDGALRRAALIESSRAKKAPDPCLIPTVFPPEVTHDECFVYVVLIGRKPSDVFFFHDRSAARAFFDHPPAGLPRTRQLETVRVETICSRCGELISGVNLDFLLDSHCDRALCNDCIYARRACFPMLPEVVAALQPLREYDARFNALLAGFSAQVDRAPQVPGVYRLDINTPVGKLCYVGQAFNLQNRLWDHATSAGHIMLPPPNGYKELLAAQRRRNSWLAYRPDIDGSVDVRLFSYAEERRALIRHRFHLPPKEKSSFTLLERAIWRFGFAATITILEQLDGVLTAALSEGRYAQRAGAPRDARLKRLDERERYWQKSIESSGAVVPVWSANRKTSDPPWLTDELKPRD